MCQLDIGAALPLATSTPVTNLRQYYINSDLDYDDLKFQLLRSNIATVYHFEVAIFNALCLFALIFTAVCSVPNLSHCLKT